jgi:hypothetical protein
MSFNADAASKAQALAQSQAQQNSLAQPSTQFVPVFVVVP